MRKIRPSGMPVQNRNHLQNDELLEYALWRSDLFYPSFCSESLLITSSCGTAPQQQNKDRAEITLLHPPGEAGAVTGLERRVGYHTEFSSTI